MLYDSGCEAARAEDLVLPLRRRRPWCAAPLVDGRYLALEAAIKEALADFPAILGANLQLAPVLLAVQGGRIGQACAPRTAVAPVEGLLLTSRWLPDAT